MTRAAFLRRCWPRPLAALAHHGWSEYDSAKLLKLTGKIVESGYEHPHGHMRAGDAGQDLARGAGAALAHGAPRPGRRSSSSPAPPRRSRATPTATSPRKCAPSASSSTARPSSCDDARRAAPLGALEASGLGPGDAPVAVALPVGGDRAHRRHRACWSARSRCSTCACSACRAASRCKRLAAPRPALDRGELPADRAERPDDVHRARRPTSSPARCSSVKMCLILAAGAERGAVPRRRVSAARACGTSRRCASCRRRRRRASRPRPRC